MSRPQSRSTSYLYLDMHGLVFETSIWLLAGSTRYVHVVNVIGGWESIDQQTPKSPPHHRHWFWPPIETIVGRSLHSLPTGLIKTPWIGVRAFVLYLSLGLARRFGAIAEVVTKAMPYVRPEVHKLQRTALYSNQTGERGSRNQVRRVQTVLLPRGY